MHWKNHASGTATLPTPPATDTYIPIPHAAVVETLVETLSHRQISVVGEEFAVSKDDMEMFGVLDLATSFEGCRILAETARGALGTCGEFLKNAAIEAGKGRGTTCLGYEF